MKIKLHIYVTYIYIHNHIYVRLFFTNPYIGIAEIKTNQTMNLPLTKVY